MSDKTKINITIDKEINEELEKGNLNKSKLINSLIDKWIKSDKKDVKMFRKK